MTKHYNTSIIEDANRIFNTKGNDNILNDVSPVIQPIIEVKRPGKIFEVSGTLQNATSQTIFTTPNDKDLYLTSGTFSFIKDATSTATELTLKIYDYNGVQRSLIRVMCLTLTAQSNVIPFTFPLPIKLQRNTIITLTSDTNVATIRVGASLQGYEVETTRGV